MKRLLLLLFLPASLYVNAQQARLPLNFNSYAIRLSVAKDESLCMATRMGEVGLTSSFRSEWRKAEVDKAKTYGKLFEQPVFFNKDTGFISGFINNDRKYNIIYHTTDGGNSWKAIDFGLSGWVDDAVGLNNGEAWLSVSGSGIAYTNDYGPTWKKFNNPEVKQRFATIFFNTERHGIAGSLWNLIAYTEDNCKTWKFLPTPLDQGKYKKTNKGSRPEINRVAIFGKYFLVAQEDMLFYSSIDSIDWKPLPAYNDFYTDAENAALFFKTGQNAYVSSDSFFKPVHEFHIKEGSFDAKCKNGNLYIAGQERMIRLNTRNELEVVGYTNKDSERDPVEIGYTSIGILGVANNKLFLRKDYEGAWKYHADFPYPLDSASLLVMDKDVLRYDRHDDSLFYFSISGKLLRKFSKSGMVQAFVKSRISKIVFSQGSRGCFHYYKDNLTYENLGKVFGNPVALEDSKKPGMPDNNDEIDTEDVNKLMSLVPGIFQGKLKTTIEDLAFSERDFERCKKDILEFQASTQSSKKRKKETSFSFNRNNLDFDRLISLVDSVKNIKPAMLEKFFLHGTGMWSTTTIWKDITFINDDGEQLLIRCDYFDPNAFYLPWSVSLNGHIVQTTSIEINRFIEKVYPAFFDYNNKMPVLHELVKTLY